MTKEDKREFTLRIAQANPTELTVILYDMLLCYLGEAEEAFQKEELPGLHEASRKARGCLNELLNSLHMEYAPAPELARLYLFCIRRLAAGEYGGKAAAWGEIRRIIRPLRQAYGSVAAQNTSGPVMNNSQTVYAGLTYGPGALTENVADQGANRGMFA